MDTNVHHYWVPFKDDGFDWLRVAPACSGWPEIDGRIVARVDYDNGRIDPHFTTTDLCAHCVEIVHLARTNSA